MIADPLDLLVQTDPDDDLPPEERVSRERMRETASGVTTFATDKAVTVVAFPLAGRLFVAGLISGDGPRTGGRRTGLRSTTRTRGAARLAYVCGSALRIAELDGSSWELASDEDPDVSWGIGRLHRRRGAASLPRLLVEPRRRGDRRLPSRRRRPSSGGTSPTRRRPISRRTRCATRRPARRTPWSSLHVLASTAAASRSPGTTIGSPTSPPCTGSRTNGCCSPCSPATSAIVQVLEANPTTGDTAAIFTDHDDTWVELVPGTPDELDDGRLVMAADRDGVRRLLIDGEPVTPTDLQVRAVVGGARELGRRSTPTIPTTRRCSTCGSGATTASPDSATGRGPQRGGRRHDDRAAQHVARRLRLDHPGRRRSDADVVRRDTADRSQRLDSPLRRSTAGDGGVAAARPRRLSPAGPPRHRTAVRTCSTCWHRAAGIALSQWFADQGFAVVVVDGRGTPGRGSEWERAVHLDLATRDPRRSGRCAACRGATSYPARPRPVSRSAAGASVDTSPRSL